MARLCAYYSLCPLIDQKSLLGVAEDSTSERVIVTLGKNIVIRYKLLNQKQISSWSSKEKLSSPVIYDSVGNQYFAVFNRTQLRIWTENDENLDKVKKIKFQEQVHCILPQKNGGEPLIIFNNGMVEPLSTALETRKIENHQSLLTPDEVIEDCHLVTCESSSFVTLFSRNSSVTRYHVVPLSEGTTPLILNVVREKVNLIGQTTIHQTCQLLTLWSDGKLFSLPFLQEPSPQSPGTFVNIVSAVSTKHPIAMTPLSSSHVAMYGADPSEEGAVLIIYNIHYGVVQSRHHFKLFASPPRLWCMSSNLLIATAHNLVVVPYNLEAQKLSALVGAHCSNATQSEHNSELQELHLMQSGGWEINGEAMDTTSPSCELIPKAIRKQLEDLEADGCPQFMMVEKLLPQLIETNSISELLWCIKHFTDIPESSLVQVLQFCLKESARTEKGLLDSQLLRAVISAPFSDVCMLPYLRLISFPQALSLLQYLADELESNEPQLDLSHLLDWANLLLDAHYQRCLLSGDPEVVKLLCRLRELTTQQIEHMEELKEMQPLLHLLEEGKLPVKRPANKLYSIELLRLY